MRDECDDESVGAADAAAAGNWNSEGGGVGDVSAGSGFAMPTRAMAELALDSEPSMGEGILPMLLLLSPPASIPTFAVSPPSDMTTVVDVDVSFGDAAVDAAGRGGGGNLAVDTPCRFFRCFVRSPLYLNELPQMLQMKGFSPVCFL